MSLQKDAKITVGVDGADEVASAANRALRPWENASKQVGSAMASMGKGITDTFKQVTSDVARGITAFAAFDFAQQIRSSMEFKESVARMSVVAGQSSEQLTGKFKAQEQAILSGRKENEAFAATMGRLTYDYRNAAQAADSLGIEALAANRSLAEMSGIGKVVHESLGSFDGLPDALGKIRTQAQALGTLGGPDALRDQVEALSGAISHLSIKGSEDFSKVTALAGALGKGLRPEQASRVQQAVFGAITSDPRRFERFLGHKITDAQGHVEDPLAVAEEIQSKAKQRYGRNAGRIMGLNFGAEAGAAWMNADFAAARAAADRAPSKGAQRAVDKFKQTTEGQTVADQIAMRGGQMDIGESMDPLARKFISFAGQHPLAAAATALLGPGLAAKGAGFLFGKGLGAVFGSGTAGSGGAGAAAGAAGLTGAGVLGFGAGLGIVGASALATGKVLTEVGEDRDKMGGRYLSENSGVPGLAQSQVAQIARSASRAKNEQGFLAGLPGPLLEAINKSPDLQQVAAGAYGGQIDESKLTAAMKEAVRAAIKEGGFKITIVNGTDGPLEALDEQGAQAAAGAQ